MVDFNIDIMMQLLDKYCLDKECILTCKARERLLKYDCVIVKFIEYIADGSNSPSNQDGEQE